MSRLTSPILRDTSTEANVSPTSWDAFSCGSGGFCSVMMPMARLAGRTLTADRQLTWRVHKVLKPVQLKAGRRPSQISILTYLCMPFPRTFVNSPSPGGNFRRNVSDFMTHIKRNPHGGSGPGNHMESPMNSIQVGELKVPPETT